MTIKAYNGEEFPSYEWWVSSLSNVVAGLYADLLEADECQSGYYVEKWARHIVKAGVGIGYQGIEQLFDAIKLNDKLAEQYEAERPEYAEEYRAKAERHRELARFLGWNVVEGGYNDRA